MSRPIRTPRRTTAKKEENEVTKVKISVAGSRVDEVKAYGKSVYGARRLAPLSGVHA